MYSTKVSQDLKRNHKGKLALLKSLLVPDAFNAQLWIRFYSLMEAWHIPTFFIHRYLLHIQGLEYASKCVVGGGLYLPHPRGVLFADGTVIGKNVSIYGNVRFLGKFSASPHVGHDVFIGDGAILIGGVIIGEGSTIGAGSVVTKDVAAGVVVAGNPARVIKVLEVAKVMNT